MKQFIVLAAVLPILLLFLSQYCLDQKNNQMINVFQQQVYAAKEEAKQEGCFTAAIKDKLRKNLSRTLGVSPEEILIEATETKQYRLSYFDEGGKRGMIHYRISFPLHKVMAGERLLGLAAEENTRLYSVEGSTASECLP